MLYFYKAVVIIKIAVTLDAIYKWQQYGQKIDTVCMKKLAEHKRQDIRDIREDSRYVDYKRM